MAALVAEASDFLARDFEPELAEPFFDAVAVGVASSPAAAREARLVFFAPVDEDPASEDSDFCFDEDALSRVFSGVVERARRPPLFAVVASFGTDSSDFFTIAGGLLNTTLATRARRRPKIFVATDFGDTLVLVSNAA